MDTDTILKVMLDRLRWGLAETKLRIEELRKTDHAEIDAAVILREGLEVSIHKLEAIQHAISEGYI